MESSRDGDHIHQAMSLLEATCKDAHVLALAYRAAVQRVHHRLDRQRLIAYGHAAWQLSHRLGESTVVHSIELTKDVFSTLRELEENVAAEIATLIQLVPARERPALECAWCASEARLSWLHAHEAKHVFVNG